MIPVIIDTMEVKFIMIECPTDKQMGIFIDILKKNNVNYLVRINQNVYDTTEILYQIPELIIKDMYFRDGDYPPNNIINDYMLFKQSLNKNPIPVIAIHCIASLGRSPCIIALQMINDKLMGRYEIINYIRNKKKGCFNSKQLKWVLEYQPEKTTIWKKIKSLKLIW